jgi:hypothetical protein
MLREPQSRRVVRVVAFVVSAAAAAVVLRFTWDRPVVSAVVLLLLAAVVLVRFAARRRLRRTLVSGDVEAVLREWSSTIARAPHAPTMAPLMTATAFAANGWIEQARAALAAAQRGPAWDAALEHRLFLDTLLLTFEGDREEALRQADRLARLPMPAAPPPMRERIALMRGALGAFARAFAHCSERGDSELLDTVARQSPLVHWAMRYASAIVAIDEGNKEKARLLLDGAPHWPSESVFRGFHDELAVHAQ